MSAGSIHKEDALGLWSDWPQGTKSPEGNEDTQALHLRTWRESGVLDGNGEVPARAGFQGKMMHTLSWPPMGRTPGVSIEVHLSWCQGTDSEACWELSNRPSTIHSFIIHSFIHPPLCHALYTGGTEKRCPWAGGGTGTGVPCSGVAEHNIVGTKEMRQSPS